ncbi:MAG: ABC transporter ATP-binding protein [Clostridia bacterium]|nr:ABC transporter ATP-binding protein [Clostridia bacterium]MBR3681249.1 ABC transporter ATP-binding protein [Clostridia bacterium]
MAKIPNGKPRPKAKKGTFKRLLKTVFSFYPVLLPLTLCCIVFSAVVASMPSLFMERVFAAIEQGLDLARGNEELGIVGIGGAAAWNEVKGDVFKTVIILGCLYLLSLTSAFTYNQLMAIITQGSLKKFRDKMFARMQELPIKYFDTHNHGDVMSYYTNDIDTLRQLISQSLPQLLISGVTLTVLICIMLYFSVWMTLVIVAGVFAMTLVSKKIGGGSAKYFVRQQIAIGKTEGFVEEMMHGQKVVKVFNHEDEAKIDFDRVNNELCSEACRANKYANTLMPIINNIGNILYVLVGVVGGVLIYLNVPNLSISGKILAVSLVVPFLNITKQFTGSVGQVSNQINSVIMGLAGASRIFEILDEEPEADEGYVTLVNAKEINGVLVECKERTGKWAWKHPHKADGTVTYTELKGDVRMTDVDFEYVEGKRVLNNITLYAEPGQQVAFVGATGAGKTTITNLINRFYDIADGKIRYDGININKIKKSSLRRSLGIVLQDVNLFTGTVMDNIRYGKLDATDEECIAAAKLSGADDFITRLPDGYETMLTANGANLSQGQRQLLSIARAAVADPPVMILDEATSSIDTRTEQIVQRGMDALMEGRTVFVIAHRLSTVKNSDVIMVLDHGEIIERGSHDELIAKRGQYYRLYTGAFELE